MKLMRVERRLARSHSGPALFTPTRLSSQMPLATRSSEKLRQSAPEVQVANNENDFNVKCLLFVAVVSSSLMSLSKIFVCDCTGY